MRLNDYRTVVFDLDDTLYLERDYVRSGFRAVGRFLRQHYRWPASHELEFVTDCWHAFEAGERGRIFDSVLERFDLGNRRPAVAELVRVYREHVPRIALEPDAKTLLEELNGVCDLWIITDGPLVSQQAKVAALGLARRVGHIVYTDHWGRAFWKPHVRAFEHVQTLARAQGHDCIYIADNPAKDFRTPRQIGWSTLRVRRAAGLHAGYEPSPLDSADKEVADLWLLCQGTKSPQRRRAA
jgi:putative hydrolase of the HAD superfamily